jgi:hypothetical protein
MITGTYVGIAEAARANLAFTIAPNPASQNTNLMFSTSQPDDVNINV